MALRIPGVISITIRPVFFVFTCLIGWLYTESLSGTVMWMCIIALSVLVHEYGHALAAKLFGEKVRIELIAFGGVTIRERKKRLSFSKEFFVVFNGPLFGAILAGFSWWVSQVSTQPFMIELGRLLFFINAFWTLINLLPIMPLDGGQMMLILLEAGFGAKGVKAAYLLGGVFGLLVAFAAFFLKWLFLGVFLFIFSLESLRALKSVKLLSSEDRDEDLQKLYQKAELWLIQGELEEAEKTFLALRKRVRQGILFVESSISLATLYHNRGETILAYELLRPLEKTLSGKGKVLLHELASDLDDHELVVKLSSEVHQIRSESSIALRNARAFAGLQKREATLGWLGCVLREGGSLSHTDLNENPLYAFLREDEEFQKLLKATE